MTGNIRSLKTHVSSRKGEGILMKAVIKYTDCLQDGKNVFNTLAIRNVEILKTRQGLSIYPQITIHIKDNDELNQLISALNRNCIYEVRVVKVKPDRNIIDSLRKIFKRH